MDSSGEVLETWNKIRNETRKEGGLSTELISDFNKLDASDRVSLLRKAIHGPDKILALMLMPILKQEELMSLFSDLVYFASFTHGSLTYVRNVIKSLPRKWVVENIEEVADSYLTNNDYEPYRRLLELFFEIDENITQRLANKASASTNFDIREAGEDFIKKR
jgi:hypothetical protein